MPNYYYSNSSFVLTSSAQCLCLENDHRGVSELERRAYTMATEALTVESISGAFSKEDLDAFKNVAAELRKLEVGEGVLQSQDVSACARQSRELSVNAACINCKCVCMRACARAMTQGHDGCLLTSGCSTTFCPRASCALSFS